MKRSWISLFLLSQIVTFVLIGNDSEKLLSKLKSLNTEVIFADIHAHPDKFHRLNIKKISKREMDLYRRNLMDLVICAVSSDAVYHGGYINSMGQPIKRLTRGKYYQVKPGSAFNFTLNRLRILQNTCQDPIVVFTLNPEMAVKNKKNSQLSLVFALEGADALEGKLDNLNLFYQKGLRLLQLIHFRNNQLGFTQRFKSKKHGLTPFGRSVVLECNRLGIIIDLAHASPQTIIDTVKLSGQPVVCSHTGVKTLKKSSRHLSDQQIISIASKGGLIGIWPCSILGNLKQMIKHITYIKDLVGADHISIGSDLRGMNYIPEFGSKADFQAIALALLTNGFTEKEVGKIMGGNFLRLWKQISSGQSK